MVSVPDPMLLDPLQIEREIASVSDHFEKGIKLVHEAELAYYEADRNFDLAWAKEYLYRQGMTVAEREAHCTIATIDYREDMEIKKAVWERAKKLLRQLEVKHSGLQTRAKNRQQVYVSAGRGEF